MTAQDASVVLNEVDKSANTFTIGFTAPSGMAIGDFSLEKNPELSPTDWVNDPFATFSVAGEGMYSVSVPILADEEKNFYRVLLNDAPITPIIGSGPVSIEEGDSSGIPIVFGSPFSGDLPYVITFADGTTESGTLALNSATSAVIPLPSLDDGLPSGLRFGTITIPSSTPGGGTATLAIEDNDEIWDGIFVPDGGGELTFCLQLIRENGGTELQLVNPTGSNFLPVGAGPAISSPKWTDSTVNVSLKGPTLAESPLGVPLHHRLTLEGEVLPNVDTTAYQGTGILETIVGIGSSLIPDEFEANDTFDASADLGMTPIDLPNLSIDQANNDDFFRFTVAGNQTVTIQTAFVQAEGDIDMELFDESGNGVEVSASETDNERIDVEPDSNETFVLRVYGFGGARNTYRLYVGPEHGVPADLSTSRPGAFMLIKRPLSPADGRARLLERN